MIVDIAKKETVTPTIVPFWCTINVGEGIAVKTFMPSNFNLWYKFLCVGTKIWSIVLNVSIHCLFDKPGHIFCFFVCRLLKSYRLDFGLLIGFWTFKM